MGAKSTTLEIMKSNIITKMEAAEYLRVSKYTIKTLVDEHGLPYVVVGKRKMFNTEELDKWLENQAVDQKEIK